MGMVGVERKKILGGLTRGSRIDSTNADEISTWERSRDALESDRNPSSRPQRATHLSPVQTFMTHLMKLPVSTQGRIES